MPLAGNFFLFLFVSLKFRCEGFELRGTAAFIAIENSYKDQGCFDEFHFYADQDNQMGVEMSVVDIPFASCAFPPVQFDSNLTRQILNNQQGGWQPAQFFTSSIFCSPETLPSAQVASIQVSICDFDYAGTSDPFRLLICSKDGHEDEYSECCLTERSGQEVRRGGTLTWHSEKLGTCSKKKFKQFVSVRLIFPGTDMVCVDKVIFNNEPPCNTCLWADSRLVKRCTSPWRAPTLTPVRCSLAEGKTIKKITIKICENSEVERSEKLVLVLENDDKEACWTSPLNSPDSGQAREYSAGQLGNSCSRFKVTERLRIWVYTTPGKASLCLTDTYLDISNSDLGSTRSMRCILDLSHGQRIPIAVDGFKSQHSVPLTCA